MISSKELGAVFSIYFVLLGIFATFFNPGGMALTVSIIYPTIIYLIVSPPSILPDLPESAFAILYGIFALVSTGGVLAVGAFTGEQTVGWKTVTIAVSFYALLTLMITMRVLLVDSPSPETWRLLAGGEIRSKTKELDYPVETYNLDSDYDYPDHPLRLTWDGLGTRLDRLISKMESNHGPLKAKPKPLN